MDYSHDFGSYRTRYLENKIVTMLNSNIFSNRKILVIGMGKTGRSISNALIKSKANVFVWDDNKTIRKI